MSTKVGSTFFRTLSGARTMFTDSATALLLPDGSVRVLVDAGRGDVGELVGLSAKELGKIKRNIERRVAARDRGP